MDTTIRNLDERLYRRLKAHAALTGKTIGELVNAAIDSFLSRGAPADRRGTLRSLRPEPYPPGNERLSEEIDRLIYATASESTDRGSGG